MIPYREGLQTGCLTNTIGRRSIAIGNTILKDTLFPLYSDRMIPFVAPVDTFNQSHA